MASLKTILQDVLFKFKVDSFKPEQRVIYNVIWTRKDCAGVLLSWKETFGLIDVTSLAGKREKRNVNFFFT